MKPVASPNDRAYINSKKPLRLMEDILRDEISELKIIIKSRDNKIAELDRRVSELENVADNQTWPSMGDGFSGDYVSGYEKACTDISNKLKANQND